MWFVPGVRPRPFRNVTWKPCRQSADVVGTATCCDFSRDLALSNSGRAGFPPSTLRDVNYRPAKAAKESFQEKSSHVSPRRTEKCCFKSLRVPQESGTYSRASQCFTCFKRHSHMKAVEYPHFTRIVNGVLGLHAEA